MDKAFEVDGFWWVPEAPEKEVPGKLSFTPGEHVVLQLMGALNKEEARDFPPPDFIDPPIIQGISTQGKLFTLYKCLQTSNNINFSGMSNTRFIAHFAFAGVHFANVDEIKFIDISVRYQNLDDWFSKRGFEHVDREDGAIVLTYKKPESIKTAFGNTSIDFIIHGPISSFDRFTHAEISQEAQISIGSESEKPFDDFLSLIRHLQNFLSLAMGVPTFITKAIGNTELAKEVKDERVLFYYPIEIYYPAAGWQPNVPKTPFFRMLFTLPTVENQLETILSNWIEKANVIKPVYDLFFSALYNPSIYSEFEFLSLTQALETYHRQIHGGKYLPDEEFLDGLYKALVSAIPTEIANDFKSSLKQGKLRFANEYSLRKRLQLIGEHIAENVQVPFLKDKKQRNIFIEKVADTRNYFTHFPEELREKAVLGGQELRDLRMKLRLILQICLLEELGFAPEAINDMFKKSHQYSQYFQEER